jgi:hypothetical protein
LYRRLGGAQKPVWTLWRREIYLSPAGNGTPAVQFVAIPTPLKVTIVVLSPYIPVLTEL